MEFTKKLPDGQRIIISKAFWTGITGVRLDNGILGTLRFAKQQTFQVKYKDGTEHSLTVKHNWLDPMPLVLLDGNDVFASERFGKLQTAIICLPVLIVLKLGAIPALIGCGSVYLNFFIARLRSWHAPLRWALIGLVPVIGFVFVFFVSDLVWGVQKSHEPASGYYLKTPATTHQYDPTEDDRNPRLWAQPTGDPAERARQLRWVEEGR